MVSNFTRRLKEIQTGQHSLAALLPPQDVEEACQAETYHSQAPVYTPWRTLITFLQQLIGADGSCQQAVDDLAAHQAANGKKTPSVNTGGYCKARSRLPEEIFWRLARQSGQLPDEQAPAEWRWKNHRVRPVDGSTLKIADSEANRGEYPLQKGLQAGLHYPVVRILIIFSLAVGTVLDAVISPYQGKGTGETGMLRSRADLFCVNDVLLGDRYYAGWWDIAFWLSYGVHTVSVNTKSRKVDFRKGKRLGKKDHVVPWKRTARPDWVEGELAASAAETLMIRELEVCCEVPGFRVKKLIIITTLLAPEIYSGESLGGLYRRRWQAELNLRSLKTHLGMEMLACKTPAMVRKEFCMYLLAYNSVRHLSTEAAREGNRLPWEMSFTHTRQTLNAFFPRYGQAQDVDHWIKCLYQSILKILVGQRPDRTEPRQCKTRPKEHGPLKNGSERFKDQKT